MFASYQKVGISKPDLGKMFFVLSEREMVITAIYEIIPHFKKLLGQWECFQ